MMSGTEWGRLAGELVRRGASAIVGENAANKFAG
jgi:hypothetical protein